MEYRNQGIQLPVHHPDPSGSRILWRPPVYNAILRILTNPVYAGAYAFGKTESRTAVVEGRAKKTDGHRKRLEEWNVLIRDHHPPYISWEQFERNQEDSPRKQLHAHRKRAEGRPWGTRIINRYLAMPPVWPHAVHLLPRAR
jgi:hypothetical protein